MIQSITLLDTAIKDDFTINIANEHPYLITMFILCILFMIIISVALVITLRRSIQSEKHLLSEQKKLKRSYLFSQSILNAIPDELFRITRDGEIISTLDLPEDVEDISDEYTYIGQSIYHFWHFEFAKKIGDTIKQVLNSKIPTSFEFNYLQNNAMKWFNIQMVPFNELEVLTSIRDLSDHRTIQARQLESEFLFQTQFDFGSNGIGILSERLDWIKVNKSLADMLEYTVEELIKQEWQEIIVPEDYDYDMYVFTKFRDNKIQKFESDKRLISKSGKTKDVNYCIFLYNDTVNLKKYYIVTFQDISFRKEHERVVLNAIIETEEKERTHFAQEIHDGVGPILSSIKMYVQWLSNPNKKISKEEIIQDIENLVQEAQEAVREVSFKLSPHVLKNFGLIASLQSYATKLTDSSFINVTFEVDEPKRRFPDTTEIILYRTLTECINNTLKHANAKNISISMTQNDAIINILYKDDGIGFNAQEVFNSAKGNGLFNIQNRLKSINGECTFLGALGAGTKILFKLTS